MATEQVKDKKGRLYNKRPTAVINDAKKVEALSDKLYTTMEKVLKFANEVFDSNEMIEVKRWTKDGKYDTFKVEKYTPEHKLRVMEIITPKVFADKKDISMAGDPSKPVPVAFNFVPLTKKE